MRSWRAGKAGLLVFVCLSLKAQTIEPQALLQKARLLISATVRQAQRVTCTETVERNWYVNRKSASPGCDTDRGPETGGRKLVKSDRLRLDVAVGAREEIFSWHGEKSFRTDEIDEVVTGGPISSGTFFSFLSSIFLEGSATVYFQGVHNERGEARAEFGYKVPIAKSGFSTRTESGKEAMGYHGRFLVDLKTAELVHLEVFTDDMPEGTWVCSFDLQTNYALTKIGGVEFELPLDVVMDVSDRNREHTETFTRYRDCHQFLGESKLRFDSGSAESAPNLPPVSRSLPPGLKLQIRIASEINPETAWAGDPIRGELAKNLAGKDGKVLVPKGTAVNGRLTRITHFIQPDDFYTVEIKFDNLAFSGTDYSLTLNSVAEQIPFDIRPDFIQRRIELADSPVDDKSGAFRYRSITRRVKLKGRMTYWTSN